VGTNLLSRIYERVTVAVDRLESWHRFPLPEQIALLIGMRNKLRADNLYHPVSGEVLPELDPKPDPRWLAERTVDGAYNDLAAPAMGMAGTRFGRNVPLAKAAPEVGDRLMTPNPRKVSTELLARGPKMIPATTLNVLAAAWLQFETRDWFSHGTDPKRMFEIRRPEGDDWPTDPILVPRTRRDPSNNAEMPDTFVNTETHWWDASQLYGSTVEFQQAIRKPKLGPGKLAIGADGLIDVDPNFLGTSGGQDGWWVGLELLHTLFMREHNAVCEMLHTAYPSWSDDLVFGKARLVIAALIAKIHTVEWTPGILNHPSLQVAMRANWFGLAGERVQRLLGRLADSDTVSGIPGSTTDHHSAPYAITEEFVSVYRMHQLVPDEFKIRSLGGPTVRAEVAFLELAGAHTREALRTYGPVDLLYSLGTAHPGAITLHNNPRFMQHFRRVDGMEIDLGAVDILRSRERGVPRYNEFRRLMHMKPMTSFEDLAQDPKVAAELAAVYDTIEDVDLTVGVDAEKPPPGFGFSDTAFRVFILMASRRLKSDRFFTVDFTPEVYTPEGFAWIADNTMSSVLVRHYPELSAALRGMANPFAPWNDVAPSKDVVPAPKLSSPRTGRAVTATHGRYR
jgi:hypothetical protein